MALGLAGYLACVPEVRCVDTLLVPCTFSFIKAWGSIACGTRTTAFAAWGLLGTTVPRAEMHPVRMVIEHMVCVARVARHNFSAKWFSCGYMLHLGFVGHERDA